MLKRIRKGKNTHGYFHLSYKSLMCQWFINIADDINSFLLRYKYKNDMGGYQMVTGNQKMMCVFGNHKNHYLLTIYLVRIKQTT